MARDKRQRLISIIVPVFNEEANLRPLFTALRTVVSSLDEECEFIFVNDASTDNSKGVINELAATDNRIVLIDFSRNFGKEIATTAGLNAAKGDAALMIDADLQHPPELIPEFVAKWHAGAEVVIGVRKRDGREVWQKRLNSWLFYRIINSVSEVKLVPRSTDFRLVDRMVIDEFNRFSERSRITRGLIDWLGFRRDYIYFKTNERLSGKATYSFTKLLRLASHSFISLSLFPLRIAGWLGIIITATAATGGLFVFVEELLLRDPLRLKVSGSAILTDINMFLIGIVLISIGLVALYIANIHTEVINRPLYVVRPQPTKLSKQRKSQT